MNIAVVILTYEGASFLRRYLSGIKQHLPEDASIIIADNASTDDTLIYLSNEHPELKVIRISNNLGFAGGYNEALSKVEAKYYVLLNSDVEVKEDWISPIISMMEKNPKIAACQPKILSLEDKEKFEHAGAAGGWIDYFGYPFCKGRMFETTEIDFHQYDQIEEIFWASGAAMVIQAELFHAAGGFDTLFFAHMEEIDLCFRLKRMNYSIYSYPLVSVYHLGGGTLPYNSSNKAFLNFRNNLFLLLKNESIGKLIWLLPFRMILDGIAAFKFLLEGKRDHFKAVFIAHIDFYRKFGLVWQKRKTFNAKNRKKMNRNGIYPGSIVWQYFALGTKQFQILRTKVVVKI